jgi:hypothetical protein
MTKLFLTAIISGALVTTMSGTAAAAPPHGFGGHAMGHAVARSGAAGRPTIEEHARPRVVVPNYRYGAFGFDPFWYGLGWGYYGDGYPYVVPSEETGGLRLEVTPKTAAVLVDGYYAGVVDDFDGHFQHLDMSPGGHRIDIQQPGFQPLTFQAYVQPGHTSDYKGVLTPVAP